MFVRVFPSVAQVGVVADDVHGRGDGYTVEITCGDDIPTDFGSLASEFGKFPCTDEAMGFEVVRSFISTFGEQLSESE